MFFDSLTASDSSYFLSRRTREMDTFQRSFLQFFPSTAASQGQTGHGTR
jgi:hypothetical protein